MNDKNGYEDYFDNLQQEANNLKLTNELIKEKAIEALQIGSVWLQAMGAENNHHETYFLEIIELAKDQLALINSIQNGQDRIINNNEEEKK